MNTELSVVLVLIAVAVLVAGAVWYSYRRITSQRLKQRFGREYDQTVRRLKDRKRAEAELKAREKVCSSMRSTTTANGTRSLPGHMARDPGEVRG